MRTQLLLAAFCAAALLPGAVCAQAAYQTGYYDDLGNWIATSPSAAESGLDAAYAGPLGTRSREAELRRRIDADEVRGDLTPREARSARLELNTVQRLDDAYRRVDGDLNAGENGRIQTRLDALEHRLYAMTE